MYAHTIIDMWYVFVYYYNESVKTFRINFFFLYTDNEFEKMSYDFKIFFYHVIYISF